MTEDQESRNLDIVNAIYRDWNDSKAGSAEDIFARLDENVVWRSLADGREGVEFTATRKGKKAVGEYFAGLVAEWNMNDYTINEVIAKDDRVVVLATVSWTSVKTGKMMTTEKADVIRMRDGLIVDFMEYYDTATMLETIA